MMACYRHEEPWQVSTQGLVLPYHTGETRAMQTFRHLGFYARTSQKLPERFGGAHLLQHDYDSVNRVEAMVEMASKCAIPGATEHQQFSRALVCFRSSKAVFNVFGIFSASKA